MKVIKIVSSDNQILNSLKEKLRLIESSELVFLSRGGFNFQLKEVDITSLFKELKADVLFSASADFPFDVQGLNTYYWKYYPRERGTYHYLHSSMILGSAGVLRQFFEEIEKVYGAPLVEASLKGNSLDVDAFHRYYIDLSLGLEKSTLNVSIDHNQVIFGQSDGRNSVFKWPIVSLRHGFIFQKYEHAEIGEYNHRLQEWDYVDQEGLRYNKRINQLSGIVSIPEANSKRTAKAFIKSFGAYIHSLYAIIKIFLFNGGKRYDHEIFRFRHNQNPEIKDSIDILIDNIESGKAFSFTHFNDGEMTFIKKFQEQDHKEVWFGSYFGRIQDKYNKQLGELLLAAFLKRQNHYYIGTPCEVSHPKLSEYARSLRSEDDYTIPAMTFHHNLSKYPTILGAIRKKKVYFVVNINQDLTFFRQMGFHFDDEQVILVPFRNAHEQYHELKERVFEEGAIVMLMSGMLAKILCAYWFERYPQTTFIAFGSSFDDYIQSKINFNLYPKKFPFSKTLIGSRSYLFGYKKQCPNCYDMSKPNPGF